MSGKRVRNNGDLTNYFNVAKRSKTPQVCNEKAQALGAKLDCKPTYLTKDGNSWYILKNGWLKPKNSKEFVREWDLHPTARHEIKLFGKTVQEKRWSQSWGVSYSYSGSTNKARPLEESIMVPILIQQANDFTKNLFGNNGEGDAYNACLQNWYEPDDTIGLHADDERTLRPEYPIFSLSWGGTRRFLFRARAKDGSKTDLLLKNGDLLIMGGTCQQTHRHEVPKLRKTMDPPTSDRINWTIRAFREA